MSIENETSYRDGHNNSTLNQIVYKVDIKEDKANHVGYSLQYHLISIITVASKKEEYTLKEEEVSSLSTSLDVILRDTYDRLTRTTNGINVSR